MPATIRPTTRPRRTRRAVMVFACAAVVAACSSGQPSAVAAPNGLLALVADPAGTTLVGWDDSGDDAIPITLPKGDTVWVASGRADVLAITLANGTTATSDPVDLGTRLRWRTVKAETTEGVRAKGPDFFATWDAGGGRYATLAGDVQSGDAVRVSIIDPSDGTAFEIPIDRPVVAAPPAWIDADRLAIVTGDAGEPTATIVDAASGELSDGPTGARLLATSANGRRIATMAGQGAPVVIRETSGWLGDDGSSLASIEPAGGSTTAIAFALDATGDRLVVAWAASDGTVSLAIHDARAGWKRVAQPKIGEARGAVVAWLR